MFGKSVEVTEGGVRVKYTGVQNFEVIAVNPTKEEIEKIYGRDINYEVEYVGETTITDGDSERTVPQIRLDFYLFNKELNISTKAVFYMVNTHHKSATGKIKVINDFGNTTWLTEEDIKSGDAPGNMSWYNMSGVKIAKRGEEEVIDFLKNLLNLPIDLSKLSDPSEAHAKFKDEMIKDMFNGKFKALQDIISSSNNKIGLLLGVKTKADGGMVQTVYTRKSLRQYILNSSKADKFKYLTKDLSDAKANGAFGNVDFGPNDFVFREHVIIPSELNASNLPSGDTIFEDGSDDGAEDFDF